MNFAEVKARHKKSDFHMGAAKRNQETVYPFKNYGEQAHQDRGSLIEQLEEANSQYEDLYEDNVDLVEQLDAALKLQRYRAVNTRPRWEPVGIEDRYTGAPWMEPHKEGQYVSYASLQAALKPRTVVDALKDLLQAAEDYSAREKP